MTQQPWGAPPSGPGDVWPTSPPPTRRKIRARNVLVGLVAAFVLAEAVIGGLNGVARQRVAIAPHGTLQQRVRSDLSGGYITFVGPLGRRLPEGRPWGRACQPVRLAVEKHVADPVYAQVAAVVAEARRGGLDIALETRGYRWYPTSLFYPPGVVAADVKRVGVFSDALPAPRLQNGSPERVGFDYDAAPDADGGHEVLTSAMGTLRMATLAGHPREQRTAVRQLVALTQGVHAGHRAKGATDTGLSTGTAADAFTRADLAVMRAMSGCRDIVVPDSPPAAT